MAVNGLEGGQKPLAPFAVEAGDPRAQPGDGGFQIGLLVRESVVLDLHLARVFLGTQVDRTQRVARAAVAGDRLFQRGHVGHRLRVGTQPVEQRLRRGLRLVGDLARRLCGALRGGLCRCFRTGACLAGFRGRALGRAFRGNGIAQRGLGCGQSIGSVSAARFRGFELICQFLAFCGDLSRAGARCLQFVGARCAALLQFRDSLVGACQPFLPVLQFAGDLLPTAGARLARAAQLVMRGARGKHGGPRLLAAGAQMLDRAARRVEIAQRGHCILCLGQTGGGGLGLLGKARHGEAL